MAMSVSDLTPQPTRPVETRWRRIRTPIPVPESIPIIRRLRAAEPRSMAGMPPILWHEADGFLVRDPYGNQWIDLTSGIVVANTGHSHPKILAAVRETLDQRLVLTYAFPAEARLRLLEKLVALVPIPNAKAILYSSGTEATECAIMLMRGHGARLSTAKRGILSFEAGYHGRTLGARLASGTPQPTDWITREQVHYHQIPFPFCPQCPWGRDRYDNCGAACFGKCTDALKARGVDPATIAGVIAEPMPGWATWPLPPDFAHAMAQWARQHDILLTFDEIQCGCGRSGRFFAFEHVGVVPDLIALGKGLSSSLPVSAVIGPREIMDEPAPGEMSSTHGGSPACAAAALANLQVIEEDGLVERSSRTGVTVLQELRALQRRFPERFLSVHGKGLFISAHLKRPRDGQPDVELADAVALEAVRRGVMMFVTGRGYLKFTPPLCIDVDAALEAVEVIRDCLSGLIA